jgi:hypothetical protein
MKTPPTSLEVAFAMQKFGNPFIKALAGLIIVADTHQLNSIRMAFRKEWAEYAEKFDSIRTVKITSLPAPSKGSSSRR